jgi:predicted ATPase
VTAASSTVGLRHIEIRGFRSARDVAFSPRRLCALVGEAQAGKSTLLAAIRAVLDPEAAPLTAGDLTAGETRLAIRAELASGATLTLDGPPTKVTTADGTAPSVLFLPATERAGQVVAASGTAPRGAGAMAIFREVLAGHAAGEGDRSTTSPALGLVEAVERCCKARTGGFVLLIEEPEMYLRPQAQRYLYRLLRELSLVGNQVIYSTHSPAFLNVARLDELTFVTRGPGNGTTVLQPEPLPTEDEFRLLSEFDAERSEVFLAQAAVLVEGTTEKYALPFVFQALGYDVNRSGITIVECGGKAGIPLIARICRTVGVPFVVVHDRDAPKGRQPNPAERQLNGLIAQVAGRDHTIVLVPDFEAVAGIRGHTHKPQRAWQRFTSLDPEAMPRQLTRAAELAVALAQGQRLGEARRTTPS